MPTIELTSAEDKNKQLMMNFSLKISLTFDFREKSDFQDFE